MWPSAVLTFSLPGCWDCNMRMAVTPKLADVIGRRHAAPTEMIGSQWLLPRARPLQVAQLAACTA